MIHQLAIIALRCGGGIESVDGEYRARARSYISFVYVCAR